MASPFSLETVTVADDSSPCPWCSGPFKKGDRAVRVVNYPATLPENLRGFYFHNMEHLRNWAQQAALNAMRLIATNDPTYIAHPAEIAARRDAYSALTQMTFPKRWASPSWTIKRLIDYERRTIDRLDRNRLPIAGKRDRPANQILRVLPEVMPGQMARSQGEEERI